MSTSTRRSVTSIWRRRMCAPPTMPLARSSEPRAERVRPRRAIAGRDALLAAYRAWLAGRGRGCRSFCDGARAFLDRWPEPQTFASESLSVQLACDQHVRPFITFLLLTD